MMTVQVIGSRIRTNRTNMQEPDTLSGLRITLYEHKNQYLAKKFLIKHCILKSLTIF
jgi:hypothetical protein